MRTNDFIFEVTHDKQVMSFFFGSKHDSDVIFLNTFFELHVRLSQNVFSSEFIIVKLDLSHLSICSVDCFVESDWSFAKSYLFDFHFVALKLVLRI